MALTFLSHLHISLAGEVPAPGTLDSPGIAVKLAIPSFLQEEELWRNSIDISLAICAYLQLMPHLETIARENTSGAKPNASLSLTHPIRAVQENN